MKEKNSYSVADFIIIIFLIYFILLLLNFRCPPSDPSNDSRTRCGDKNFFRLKDNIINDV